MHTENRNLTPHASPPAIPVRAAVQDLVVESTLAGCSLAGALAREGRRVLLVGSGLSPGREIAIALRAWLDPDDEEPPAGSDWHERVAPALGAPLRGGCRLIDVTAFTLDLEDGLLDSGVSLLYDQAPAGLILDGVGAVRGAVFAGKSGLFGVRAERVVDATDTGVLVRLATGAVGGSSDVRGASWVTFADGVPESLDTVDFGSGLSVQRRGPWLCWNGVGPVEAGSPGWLANLGRVLRQQAARAMPSLRERPGCGAARLLRGADALLLHGRAEPAAASLPPGLVRAVPSQSPAQDRMPASGPGHCWQAGIKLYKRLPPPTRGQSGRLFARTAPPGSPAVDPMLSWGFHDPAGAEDPFERIPWEGGTVLQAEADLVVVGGGTAGLPAAVAAAERGARVTLIEKFADLGGTRTVGGVPNYWYGRPTEYTERRNSERTAHQEERGLSLAMAYNEQAQAAGIGRHMSCVAAGVGHRGRRIEAVLAACDGGLSVFRAPNFIDATGDGDLAAWAGHAYSYGAETDEATLWYSFAKFVGTRSSASREYASVVDLRDPWDLARAAIASRRRDGLFGRGDLPCFYLAPRESRHIRGRARVTYEDILLDRRPADTVAVCRSNFDIKGLPSDPLVLAGFSEPDFHRNFDGAIPWGALLPRDLDNIVVAGKAYDAAHDALALARMQRDVIAMGAVSGVACALATGADVSAVPVEILQQELLATGLLSAGDRQPCAPPDREALLKALDAGSLPLEGQVRLVSRGAEFAEELRRRASGQGPAALLAARILWQAIADRPCGDVLLAAAERGLEQDPLPDVEGSVRLSMHPDHGWAPWPCHLVHALSQGGHPELTPLLVRLADRLPRRFEKVDASFHYGFALARAAERLGDPALAPVLAGLLERDGLRGAALPAGSDPRRTSDVHAERLAYLALCLARAGAACGDEDARTRLRIFRKDPRRWLARSAG